MIKNIVGGNGIVVTNTSSGGPYVNMNNASAGMVRYNGSSSNLEVYDGTSWLNMNMDYPSISLDSSTVNVISWARQKMAEEQEFKALMEKHPGLKNLHDQLEMMKHLCRKEEETQ